MAQAVERGSWTPNWATHPGEHLGEYIEANGWSQADFARLAGLTPKLVKLHSSEVLMSLGSIAAPLVSAGILSVLATPRNSAPWPSGR